MDNLVLVGCSLASMWVKYFKKEHAQALEDLNLEPHAVDLEFNNIYEFHMGGGGNSIGVHSLLNLYLESSEEIKNTRIICQYTGVNRHSFNKVSDGIGNGFKIKNVITGDIDEVINPGSHNYGHNGIPEHAIRTTFESLPWSEGATVRDLTSILCMLSSMGADVYAFRGWEGTMSNSTWIQVDNQLRKHGVKTDRYSSYMDHAISVSTIEEPWLDEFHPAYKTAMRAMHVMVPILFEVEKNK